MKFLIASDLHGSAGACRRLMECFNQERAQTLILLGDILYHGPRNPLPESYSPKDAADILNSKADKIFCIRGNCDADVDQAMLRFPVTAPQALIYADSMAWFLTHTSGIGNPPPMGGIDVILEGHTHIPLLSRSGTVIRLNPGSVSLPKGGFPATYAVYENRAFTIYDMAGAVVSTLEIG